MFEVPVNEIDFMMRNGGFIDKVMSHWARIPLPPAGVCNGLYALVDKDKFLGDSGYPGYAIGVDKSICLRWGEHPDPEKDREGALALRSEMETMGVIEAYLPKVA